MTTLREAIDEEIRDDPTFAVFLELADVEYRLDEALALLRELLPWVDEGWHTAEFEPGATSARIRAILDRADHEAGL